MHIYDMGFHYAARLLLLEALIGTFPLALKQNVSLQSNPDALKASSRQQSPLHEMSTKLQKKKEGEEESKEVGLGDAERENPAMINPD